MDGTGLTEGIGLTDGTGLTEGMGVGADRTSICACAGSSMKKNKKTIRAPLSDQADGEWAGWVLRAGFFVECFSAGFSSKATSGFQAAPSFNSSLECFFRLRVE
jgi:hypothetical protein